MPIVIEIQGNLYCPVVVCDQCTRKINNAIDGNYEHGESGPVYFTHKKCSDNFRQKNPEVDGAFELDSFPKFLAANLNIVDHNEH